MFEQAAKKDKMNMINKIRFAANEAIDHSTTAPTSSAEQIMSAAPLKSAERNNGKIEPRVSNSDTL